MDSVTHLAAGILTPLVFRKAPRTAALVLFGIAAGELPDIDAVAGSSAHVMLSVHRSMTHSIPVIIISACLLAFLMKLFLSKVRLRDMTVRVENGQAVVNRPDDWGLGYMFMAALLGLASHVYLDCMTTFGTQILWPFSDYRVAVPALFIVDFLFTVPLILIALYCLKGFRNPNRLDRQVKWARYGMAWLVLYPLCCFGIHQALSYKLNNDYTEVGTAVEKITLTPVLASPFYWKAVAENPKEYRLDWIALYKPFQKPEFMPPIYPKPDARKWEKLQEALPIFREFDNFATFVTVEATKSNDDFIEYTFTDLRYLYSAFNVIMEKIDSNKGLFLMQIRMGAKDKKVYAWRYLERGNDETAMWHAVRPLFTLEEPEETEPGAE